MFWAAALGIALGLPAALLLRPPPDAVSSVLDLSIGLSAAILTAVTLVLTFASEFGTWPPLREVLLRGMRIHYWFAASITGLAFGVVAATERNAALAAISIGATAFSFVLGVGMVFRGLELSAGLPRRRFLAALLAARLGQGSGLGHRKVPTLSEPVEPMDESPAAPFMQAFSTAVADGDEIAVRERVAEICVALRSLRPQAASRGGALGVRALEMVTAATISGRLEAELVPPSVRSLSDAVGDAATCLLRGKESFEPVRDAEVRAAAILGLGARGLAWAAKAAEQQLRQQDAESFALQALLSASGSSRKRLAEVADPRPFGSDPDTHGRWSHAFDDAEAALIWFWGCCELGGAVELEMYILAETLADARFQGSIGSGDSVWDWIEHRWASVGPAPSANQIAELGGLDLVLSELLVTYIAGVLPPAADRNSNAQGVMLAHLNRAARLFARPNHPMSADEALDLLGRIIGSGQPGGRLWKRAGTAYESCDPSTRIPFVPPHDRVGAAVIAVFLEIHAGSDASTKAARSDFLRRLPEPLLNCVLAWMALRSLISPVRPDPSREHKTKIAEGCLSQVSMGAVCSG